MSETIKAFVSMIAIIAVNCAACVGYSLDLDAVINVLCAMVMILVTAIGCYKNHNFTEAAQEGQRLIDEIKQGEKNA